MRRKRGSDVIHASKYEDRVIANLEARGVKYEYEPETFPYTRKVRGGVCTSCGANACIVKRRYTPDLRLTPGNVYVELKGKFTGENRSKMEDFLRGNPGFDLRFLFQRDNWLTGKHKTKYSDWARKLGLAYAVGEEIPDDWIQPG